MGTLQISHEKCDRCGDCIAACPFGALELNNTRVEVNAACKLCKICIKKCPKAAIALMEEKLQAMDKNEWKGILVYVEHQEGEIHPVTLELIGKARELAEKISHPIYCVFIGQGIAPKSRELLNYGVDKVFVYENEEFRHFRVDVYSNAFEDCIKRIKPSIVLVGATPVGRSLAPRLSTRFRTGLTADCTIIDVKPDTDMIQIRPAFGGNIMAQIVTPNSRPQFATVRYKVMNKADCVDTHEGTVEICTLDKEKLKSGIKVLRVLKKEKHLNISDAEILVVAGRGIKERKDLSMLEELAGVLGGELGVTRPLVEAGWASYTRQIGLSGRTVKPKLIVTCGVSGAVQFTASMNASEYILAINRDKNAPIFKIAHYGMVGDLYEIVPGLIERIKEEGKNVL